MAGSNVGVAFEAAKNRWCVHWRVPTDGHSEKQKLNISCCALGGDKDATERVAWRLQFEVAKAVDFAFMFFDLRDRFIAAELGDAMGQSGVGEGTLSSAVLTSDAAVSSLAVVSSVAVDTWGMCPLRVPSVVMPSGPSAVAVHLKAARKQFVIETAAGLKYWECSTRRGMFNRVRAGDLLILTQTDTRGTVVLVGEVANGAIYQESRLEVLYNQSPFRMHKALDEYLGGAAAFDYIQFTQVFDMRSRQLRYTDVLAQGRYRDPCQPWLNGLLTAIVTADSSMTQLRDFLASNGVVRVCGDGVDVE